MVELGLWALTLVCLLTALAILASCATSVAIQNLPQEWWIGLASLFAAFGEDLLNLLRFFV